MKRNCGGETSRLLRCALGVVAALAVVGCQPPGGDGSDILAGQADPDHQEAEPNDGFSQADPVAMPAGGTIRIVGSISAPSDIDVYELGPLGHADRIVADVAAGGADLTAGIFEGPGNALLINDDRDYYRGWLDPYIDMTARRSADSCYLVVSASPGLSVTGDYAITLSRIPDQQVPAPTPAVVVLDFDGQGSVQIGGLTPLDIPPFDAAVIHSNYAGRTEEMIQAIVAAVQNDFSGLNVAFYRSTDPGAPTDGVTAVYFGTYNAALLGLADSVDPYNSIPTQEAVIFTDTFALFMPLNPTVTAMGQCIGNVASHEVGHLLGLNHVVDPNALMDITASARRLLLDQAFLLSPLEGNAFPMGWQNAPQLLADTMGGTLSAKPLPAAYIEFEDDGEPLSKELFATCFCKKCAIQRLKQQAGGCQ